jgi:transcriptional activator SPT7
MDLTTMLRNVKSGRYKNKADFVTDLDLIWENCMHYNTQEVRHFLLFAL